MHVYTMLTFHCPYHLAFKMIVKINFEKPENNICKIKKSTFDTKLLIKDKC